MSRIIRETPAALTDIAEITDVDAPASVVRGDTAQFSVEVCCSAPPFTKCEDVGLQVNGEPVTDTQNVGAGDCTRFRFQRQINTDTTLTLEAVESDPLVGSKVTDTKDVVIRTVDSEGDAFLGNLIAGLRDFFENPVNTAAFAGLTLGIIVITENDENTGEGVL